MKKESIYLLIAAYLSIIILTPGRFVFGFTTMLELFLFMILGILFNSLISKLKLNDFRTALSLMFIVFLTSIYRQIFVIFQTEVAMTLGIIFYIPALSLYLVNTMLRNSAKSLKYKLLFNLKQNGIICILGLAFFLFRDLAAYGTFTFYGKNHQIYEKVLFFQNTTGYLSFLASIPGTLMFSGLLLLCVRYVKRQLQILGNVEK